jgi:tRNA(fMet)-specific endonuclease VapC
MYFLDTNTCIYFLNGRYPSIRRRLLATAPKEIAIPALVKAELLLGAYKSKKRELNLDNVERFLAPFAIVPFEDRMAYTYTAIRCEIEKRGTLIGPNDLVIAAIVQFRDGILVTNNVKEFKRIHGLKVENWVR